MPSAYHKPRPLAGIAFACLLAACGKTEPAALPRTTPPAPPLRSATARNIPAVPGFFLASEIGGNAGGRQLFALNLKKGQLADLVVDQQGVDVKVSLYAPDRRRLATVDSLYGDRGPEVLPVIAEAGETYRLEVQSADPGRYELKIAALRLAAPRDRDRVAAERLWSAGEELRARADRMSIEAAVTREIQALDLFRSLKERNREACVLHGLGEAHLSLERNAEAVRFLEQSLALYRQLGREREASRVLNDLGKAHRSLGEPAQALERYREALALNRRLGDRPAQAIMLTNLGKVYDDLLGETDTALEQYEQSLDLWHELGGRRDRSQEAVTLKSLGALYQFRGETRKALDYLEPALAILEAEGPTLQTANLLTTIGDTYSRSGQHRKAIERYQRALGIQRRIGDLGGEGVTLNSIGCTYVLMKRPREAREQLVRAAAVFRKTGNRQGQAAALTGLASVDTELRRPREALATLDQVLPLLAASGDRDTEAAALLALASARRQLGDLSAARQAIEAGIARVESLRVSSARQEIRTSFLASKQAFYSFYADLLMELGDPARALAASEEARARSLLDLLAEARADLRRGVDPRLLAREAEAARRVNAAEEKRWLLAQAGASRQRLAPAERDLRAELARYDRVQAEIRQASPRYAALIPPRPLDAEQIQRQVLDSDTLLLEYTLGRERSWLWAVTPDEVRGFPLPPRAAIEEAARRAHSLLKVSRQTVARGPTRLALAELSRLLLGPAAGLLGRKRLLVVGDGALHFIPFAALPVPGTEADPEPVPLVERHEIVTAPSASSLAELRLAASGRREPAGALAVIADPVFTSFSPLPFSREEARAILALVPASGPVSGKLSALGLDASRETVLSGELGRYRIVHFATHGVLDTDHPELSSLVLSQVDSRGRPREGFVRAHEIYRLSLPADLVVLSACSTALGQEINGEGLVGLTRGFQYAGARGVLVSLWEVEDRATAELMSRLYREMLQRGRTPAAALRTAQAALREAGWRDPYYWAGFILQGDWRPADKPFHPTGIYPEESGKPQPQRRTR